MKKTFGEAALYCAAVGVCLLIWLIGSIALIRERGKKG